MKEVTKSELTKVAKRLQEGGQTWHYHLLTPSCQFNEDAKYALLLENVDGQEDFVHYSDTPEMDLSKELAIKLHGDEVIKQANTSGSFEPNKDLQAILDLINELGEAGVNWHHHVFFPGCTFNSSSGKYELVLEDPRSGNRLVSVSDEEPKEALKQIEARFYAQDSA